MYDIDIVDLPRLAIAHPGVPVAFAAGCLLLGGAAWRLAPRRGWARRPAVLAACGLALALAVTLARPFGHYPAGGLNPLAVMRECGVGDLSLHRTYEKLNVAMLMPFAFFGALATRRPVLVATVSLLVSGSVEVLQGATGGGTCQVRDLVHNAAGAVLGVSLAVLLGAARRARQARRARRVSADCAAGSGSSR
jgi:hypothetical protein